MNDAGVSPQYAEAAARMHENANVIAQRWTDLRSTGTYSIGDGTFYIIKSRGEFRKRYTRWEQTCNNLTTTASMKWKKAIGLENTDKFTLEVEWTASNKIEAAKLPTLIKDRFLEGVAFTVEHLLQHEAACGDPTRMGAYMRMAYLLVGFPCGWDENAGILSVYQPNKLP